MSALPSFAACRRASLVAVGVMALCRPAAAAGGTDVVKAALAHGGFKAFVGLVSRAGLADTLGQSPVTVFMPTDAAFARLSAVQRKTIADLSPDRVKDFVGRFVFPGTAMASNDVDKTITSENGTTFDVTWYKGRLSLRDDRGPATSRLAYVVQGDIPAGAGVIDAVDAVLMLAATGGLAIPIAAKVPDGGTPAAISESEVVNRSALAGTSAAPGTPAPTPIPVPASAPAAVAPAVVATKPATAPDSAKADGAPAVVVDSAKADGAPAVVVVAPAPVKVEPATPPVPAPVVTASAPASAGPAASVLAPAPAAPLNPEISVAAAGLRGWPLKVSGNGSTGKVNGVMVGLPDGRVTGLTAHFGGFFGLGGRNVFVSWDRVMPDIKGHVLRARMTAAEFTAAPAGPPKP